MQEIFFFFKRFLCYWYFVFTSTVIPKLEFMNLTEVIPEIYVIRSLVEIKLQNQSHNVTVREKGRERHDLQVESGL